MTRQYHGDPMGLPQPVPRSAAHPGLVLGAIEAPAGQDEQLGQLFRQMRQATGLTGVMLAARLGIHPSTLALFESGAVLALPEWNETVRIVTALARLVGLDPGVALERIRSQRTSGPVQNSAGHAPARAHELPAMPPVPAPQPRVFPPVPTNAHPPSRQSPPAATRMQPPRGTGHYPAHAQAAGAAFPPPRPMHFATAPGPAPTMAHTQQPMAPNMQARPLSPSLPLDLGPGGGAQVGMQRTDEALSAINPLQPPRRAQPRANASPAAVQKASASGVRGRRAVVSLKLLAAPVVLVPALWYTVQNPTTVHAAIDQLPEPIPRIARAGMEIVLIGTASTKDGMRLITVSDPRHRKSDKLPTR